MIQKSRIKGIEFVQAFGPVLPIVFRAVFRQTGEDVKTKIRKLLDIWKERRLFSPDYCEGLAEAAGMKSFN